MCHGASNHQCEYLRAAKRANPVHWCCTNTLLYLEERKVEEREGTRHVPTPLSGQPPQLLGGRKYRPLTNDPRLANKKSEVRNLVSYTPLPTTQRCFLRCSAHVCGAVSASCSRATRRTKTNRAVAGLGRAGRRRGWSLAVSPDREDVGR